MLIVLDDELDLLRQMHPLDQAVFYYLAERVDFETGMIGQSRRVSYGGMAYDLSEHKAERRSRESLRAVTSKQVENSISRLVNAGLLSRQSKSGFNQSLLLVRVFWVHFWGKGNCVQKADGSADGSVLGVLLGVMSKLSTNKNNNIEIKRPNITEAIDEPDGSAVGTTSITQHTTYREGEFSMTLDWQHSEDELAMVLHRAGFSVDKVDRAWIAEWVAFWALEKNQGRRYSQHGWTSKLAMAMVDYLRDPGLYERRRGIVRPPEGWQGKAKASGVPEWARLPRDDEELTPWAQRHGYGAADIGWTYLQYRNVLRQAAEVRLKQWRQLS